MLLPPLLDAWLVLLELVRGFSVVTIFRESFEPQVL